MEMKVGDKYLAEWWFNYDMADNMQEDITITMIFEDESYSFQYIHPFTKIPTTVLSCNCRSIKLKKKLNND